MEISSRLPQDTKSSRSCFGNRAKMFILESNVTPNISRSSAPAQFSQSLMGVTGAKTIIVLLAFNVIFLKSHQLLTLPRGHGSGTLHCCSNAWGWHNSHQSGVIGITDQLISRMEKCSEVYTRDNNEPKTLLCRTPDTTLTSLLRQLSTITFCDRFDRNCVNIDKIETQIPTERSL